MGLDHVLRGSRTWPSAVPGPFVPAGSLTSLGTPGDVDNGAPLPQELAGLPSATTGIWIRAPILQAAPPATLVAAAQLWHMEVVLYSGQQWRIET